MKRGGSGDDNSNNKKKSRKITTVLEQPTSSQSDKKEYRCIELENGFKAMLISDPKPERIPSWSDLHFRGIKHMGSFIYTLIFNEITIACFYILDDIFHFGEDQLLKTYPTRFWSPFNNCYNPHKKLKFHSETPIGARAAMCLMVQAGSADDPLDCQGLAHFTEHMLHYGSKKFPGEGKYWSFVQVFELF